MGAPLLWNGNFAKFLRKQINVYDAYYILEGTVDPSVTAQNAPQGSIYVRVGASGGTLWQKQDAGNTTNWTKFTAGGGGSGGVSFVGAIQYAAGTTNWDGTSGSVRSDFGAITTGTATLVNGTGTPSIPSTAYPGIEFATLPAGTYKFTAIGAIAGTSGTAGGFSIYYGFGDGTNYSAQTHVQTYFPSSGLAWSSSNLIGVIKYATTQTNVIIRVQYQCDGGGIHANINNNGTAPFEIYVEQLL